MECEANRRNDSVRTSLSDKNLTYKLATNSMRSTHTTFYELHTRPSKGLQHYFRDRGTQEWQDRSAISRWLASSFNYVLFTSCETVSCLPSALVPLFASCFRFVNVMYFNILSFNVHLFTLDLSSSDTDRKSESNNCEIHCDAYCWWMYNAIVGLFSP